MPKVKVVITTRNKAPRFLAKAKQFCETATQQLQDGRFDSTVLCAVHAGISSADAVCVGVSGRRSADPNHMMAAALLEEVGKNATDYRTKANQLRSLINQKNRVEYEDKPASRKDAEDAADRCERLVLWAKQELVAHKIITPTTAAP